MFEEPALPNVITALADRFPKNDIIRYISHMTSNLSESSSRLRAAFTAASRGLVDRETLVELVALSAVAREHLLVIGPPGTAKSVAVRRMARATGGRYFEYLLGKFTEPNEIFGPVDLRKLREGTVETDVSGMLPEAEIAFLDEIFQGSSAILNTLLGILNERVFRRGHTRLECPLRICVGASNSLPTDESLAAFADRFLVRVFVEGKGAGRPATSAVEKASEAFSELRGVKKIEVHLATCRGRKRMKTWEHLESALLATFTGLHFRLPIYNKRKGSIDYMEDIRFFRQKALKKLVLQFEV